MRFCVSACLVACIQTLLGLAIRPERIDLGGGDDVQGPTIHKPFWKYADSCDKAGFQELTVTECQRYGQGLWVGRTEDNAYSPPGCYQQEPEQGLVHFNTATEKKPGRVKWNIQLICKSKPQTNPTCSEDNVACEGFHKIDAYNTHKCDSGECTKSECCEDWVLGVRGKSCAAACGDHGRSCTSRSVLRQDDLKREDVAAKVLELGNKDCKGYGGGSKTDYAPYLFDHPDYPNYLSCMASDHQSSNCGAAFAFARRLCYCDIPDLTASLWYAAEIGGDCASACAKVGRRCNQNSLKDSNSAVDSYDEVKRIAADLNLQCNISIGGYGNGGDVPQWKSDGKCLFSNGGRPTNSYSCTSKPGSPGARRLCYCEEASVGTSSEQQEMRSGAGSTRLLLDSLVPVVFVSLMFGLD